MQFEICKLTPKSPIHLGEREQLLESTADFIHSDTLFSAFCHCYRLLYGKAGLESILNEYLNGKIPFGISSAFPFEDDSLFFPVPLTTYIKMDKQELENKTVAKKLKTIRFMELKIFEKVLSGKQVDIKNLNDLKFLEKSVTPRVTVSRLGHSSKKGSGGFFHVGKLYFGKGAGFFFLMRLGGNVNVERVKASFNLMADEGVGGERTYGCGLFHPPEWGKIEISCPLVASASCLISLWNPAEDNGFQNSSFYRLIDRKGYLFSPEGMSMRRKTVLMVAEGSVIAENNALKGMLVDVTPELFIKHRIYRYGIPLALPCKIPEEHEN